MLTAVVTLVGESVSVHFVNSASTDTTTPEEQTVTTQGEGVVTSEKAPHEGAIDTADGLVADGGTAHVSLEEAAPGPNPIVPEVKEVLWGAGAFIVFALIMRYVAFPKLKRGMDARYDGIRNDHEQADAMRLGAQAEVADYQAQVASAKAEAAARIDAARQELETQRTTRIAAVNAEIAEQRAAAAAENEAARLAVQDQIQAAVADVSSSAIRLAVGKAPDAEVVNRVVSTVMNAGANS